jgi:hypothetical protein
MKIKQYNKTCDFCNITILSCNFAKHLKTKAHSDNKFKHYDSIIFPNIDKIEKISYNDIDFRNVSINNALLNVRIYYEERYVIMLPESKQVILDRYDSTTIKDFYIGVKYIIDNDEYHEPDLKEIKNLIIGKDIYLIDHSNKIAIVSHYLQT